MKIGRWPSQIIRSTSRDNGRKMDLESIVYGGRDFTRCTRAVILTLKPDGRKEWTDKAPDHAAKIGSTDVDLCRG